MYQKPPGFDAAFKREKANAEAAAAKEEERKRLLEESAARVAVGLPPLDLEKVERRKKRKMREEATDGRVGAPSAAGREGDAIAAEVLKAAPVLSDAPPPTSHNPNSTSNVNVNDPMGLMKARAALASSRKFQLTTKKHASRRSPARGGVDPNAANQQLLLGDEYEDDVPNAFDFEETEVEDTEKRSLLASLPREEKKRLVREYKEREKEKRKAEVAAA